MGLLPNHGNSDGMVKNPKRDFLRVLSLSLSCEKGVGNSLEGPEQGPALSWCLCWIQESPGSPRIWFFLQLFTPVPGMVLDQALGIDLWWKTLV